MAGKVAAIRHRVAPSVPFSLELTDASGSFKIDMQLRFDFNVLARIEKETGLKMLGGIDMFTTKMSSSVLSTMLWAAAADSLDPEYDSQEGLEAVRSYLDKESGSRAYDALWEAYMLFLPKKDADVLRDLKEKADKGEASPENPPTVEQTSAPNSDGSTSGQSQSTTSESVSSASAS